MTIPLNAEIVGTTPPSPRGSTGNAELVRRGAPPLVLTSSIKIGAMAAARCDACCDEFSRRVGRPYRWSDPPGSSAE